MDEKRKPIVLLASVAGRRSARRRWTERTSRYGSASPAPTSATSATSTANATTMTAIRAKGPIEDKHPRENDGGGDPFDDIRHDFTNISVLKPLDGQHELVDRGLEVPARLKSRTVVSPVEVLRIAVRIRVSCCAATSDPAGSIAGRDRG